MNLIPDKLNRGAVKRTFLKVRESTWENMFDNEKHNGLHDCRVPGPDKYAYYDVQKLMLWLMTRDLYRRSDFYEPGEILFTQYSPSIRRHVLAG